MLSKYFGFQDEPFGATPDPRWLYYSATHREALASLRYGFRTNRGFTALIAPPGMGKTTLLYQFLNDIQTSACTSFVFETQCEPLGLLRYILRDLGITPAITGDEMHEQLKEIVLKEARAGRKVVVIVDEAQNLSDEALEMLRLLTNFESPQAKLLQIVLAGQPALADKLTKPSFEQLRQRISTICLLEPFSVEETTAYIRHRLEQAGYQGAPLFRKDALKRITAASQGIPRLINNLCFNALSLCYALKRKQVDGSMAAEVIADQELDPQLREAIAARLEVAAEEPLQPDQLFQFTTPNQTTWVTKFMAAIATVLLVASGLGLSAHYADWQAWLRLTGFMHSLGNRVVSASVLSPTTTDPSKKIVAEPSKATHTNTNTLSTSSPSPATGSSHHRTVNELASKTKPFQITVEANQTLCDISMHYLGAWNLKRLHQIQALNAKLTDLDHIEAGQKIWLPAPEPTPMAPNVSLQANAGDHHEP